MTGNNIAGIAKSILQARANVKVDASSNESEQKMTVSFMELMNQNNFSSKTSVSAGSKGLNAAAGVTADTAKTAYDSCSSTQKSVSVKEEISAEKMQSEASDQLESYEKEIREVLKEELGVTDEEIEEAMESLGLTYLDLGNSQDLAALVQMLTGSDVGTLFLSESFQNVMKQVSILTDDLCAELGITREELTALCEEWKGLEASETPEAAAEDAAEPNAQEAAEVTSVQDNSTSAKTADEAPAKEQTESFQQNLTAADAAEQTKAVELSKEPETSEAENAGIAEEAVEAVDDEPKEETGGKEEQSFSQNSQQAKPDTVNPGVSAAGQQAVRTEEFILPQEAVQPYSSQVDVADLIEQIAKNTRVTITAETTSMEMQLNPENLGKIYLNISEKEGAVRAQIAAQTETVKEVLETQLVELRQSLSQQGIKVDAIEVTVATHEFEQNLEGNAKQEEQMQQREEEAKTSRRNLNLNELDGLSGLMTEEEALVAKIMRDNGNQVDLTA